MKLVRTLGSVGGLTLASRVLALVRDSLQARYVGASFASDAFTIAFRLPNMFRALFAEGAFNAAFIPMFNRKVGETGDLSAGLDFAERALSMLFAVLLGFTAIMLAAAWPITWAMSLGFNNATPDQFAFAVQLSRITIPYLMLISLASLLGGILNSLDKFWVNAAAPILLNIAMVTALVFFNGDPYETARAQAVAVPIGGLLQLAWLALACRRAGVSLRPRLPRVDPEVKRLMKLILPAAMGAGASQVNLLISSALAARLLAAGSISYIYYADRLNQLPLGLIGIGLGTILLPTISRLLGAGREAEAMETQNRGTELALFLTLPAMVALIVAAEPIVRGLFQYGAFDAADTRACAWALAGFSVGLPSYVLVKVLTPGFYARQDTRTPVRYAMWSVGVNIVANIILIPLLGHVGPPLATALASTVNVAMLYRTLRKRGHFAVDAQLRRRLPRLAVAALLMGAAVFGLESLLDPYLVGPMAMRYAALVVLVGTGCAIYGLACFVTGAFRVADVKALIRRRSTN
ncbi:MULTISPECIES: murein biosynthesis integral membrane protein MurJ [Sphingomonas]|uniref:murein biosynthesis integral membrane protein MurJ n=1 Tax=Sphingomonas TaxID=13687 RepID=UPI000F7E9855|nr:murein biosynthesis integral membrane protein MurJ [Sphingomonas sp. ABOLF]RSV14663.1 murein biosynthesis integral membrane protein MurJ [Sphingomonas sp. ABOLF]GLK19272.1 putative lipid II flippase MurJ [Microbacterium terregens]